MDALSTSHQVDKKRIGLYLLCAFGIAWTASLYIYLTGGLAGKPVLFGLNRALILVAVAVMPAPAIAHILTRLVTREGWRDLKLWPKLRRRGWLYWLLAWFVTPLLVLVGAAIYFLFFPQHFDPSLTQFRQMLEQMSGRALPVPIETVIAAQALQGIMIGPLVNALFILGEEFGWRAYLQPKLLPLGWRTAMIAMGVIWGLWHAPVILMGYNYGTTYPGAPWAGVLMMCWMTFVTGTWFGWLALKGHSVWPAVIGHGSINGFAPIALLAVTGQPNTLLGPAITGIVGSLGFTAVALILLLRTPPEAASEAQPLGYADASRS